jgi:hypothetical protein
MQGMGSDPFDVLIYTHGTLIYCCPGTKQVISRMALLLKTNVKKKKVIVKTVSLRHTDDGSGHQQGQF